MDLAYGAVAWLIFLTFYIGKLTMGIDAVTGMGTVSVSHQVIIHAAITRPFCACVEIKYSGTKINTRRNKTGKKSQCI